MGNRWWFVLLIPLALWRLAAGEPLWLVPLAIVGFVEWFMADRPARYGRPPLPSSHEPETRPTAERRHER